MKNKKTIILCFTILSLSLLGGLFFYLNSKPYKYSKAARLLDEGKVEKALVLYDQLGDYEDAADLAAENRYTLAFNYSKNEDYLKAVELYKQLGDYKNAQYFIDLCYYKHAHQLFLAENYDEADVYFSKISDDFEAGYPHFRNLEDAKEYIIQQGLLAEEKIILHLGTIKTSSSNNDLAQHITYLTHTDLGYVDWIKSDQMLVIEPVIYPGIKIAAYHKQNRTNELTEKEQELYQKALQLVKQAKQESSSLFETEVWINTWLCENSLEVSDFTYENEEDVLPRECTAFGPILFGRADCQGFSDAFYLLATLCDFNVRIQFGSNSVQEHTHVWNAIELNDQWYYVDVSFNNNSDTYFDAGFEYFNFIEKVTGYHRSHPVSKVCTTADTIDPQFDYYEVNNCSFDTLEEAAEYAINQRLFFFQKIVRLKINENYLKTSDLIEAIDAQMKNYYGSLTVQADERKGDTCFGVYWDKFEKNGS